MSRRPLLLAAAAVLLAATNVAPAGEARRITLFFDFSYNGIKAAEVTETLTVDEAGEYVIESRAAAVGLAKILYGDVRRRSLGEVDGEAGLQMRLYEEQRGRRPKQTAQYDRRTGVMTLTKGEGDGRETRTETRPAPVWDYLTAAYYSHWLRRAAGGELLITDGWRLRKYEYRAGAAVTVETGMGAMEAIPLSRDSARGRRVFWLAPKLEYLPVKTFVDDKGHIFETVLTGMETSGG